MVSETRRFILLALSSALAVACFDPLYEDGVPVDAPVVFCCLDLVAGEGTPYACARSGSSCIDEPTCSLPAYPSCVALGRCTTHACAAGGGSATGGGSGGGSAADAGTVADAGVGGGGGGAGAFAFEFCCINARVTTCACPAGGCTNAPLTLCRRGVCVAGTTTGSCP